MSTRLLVRHWSLPLLKPRLRSTIPHLPPCPMPLHPCQRPPLPVQRRRHPVERQRHANLDFHPQILVQRRSRSQGVFLQRHVHLAAALLPEGLPSAHQRTATFVQELTNFHRRIRCHTSVRSRHRCSVWRPACNQHVLSYQRQRTPLLGPRPGQISVLARRLCLLR